MKITNRDTGKSVRRSVRKGTAYEQSPAAPTPRCMYCGAYVNAHKFACWTNPIYSTSSAAKTGSSNAES